MTQPNADPSYWQAQGRCNDKGVDPNIFFPEKGHSLEPARAICALCDVRVQCLDAAIKDNIEVGIWAGTSEKERRAIRRQRTTGPSMGSMMIDNADIGDF